LAWALASTGMHSVAARADTAAEESVRLVWIRGPGSETCLASDALAERVSLRLGWQAFSDAARRRIEGFVQREGDRWVARIYARDSDGKLIGSRDLTSDAVDCAGLDAAVTLAIALVIDTWAGAALRPPPASVDTAPAPPPAPVAVSTAPPPAPPPCPVTKPCPALATRDATRPRGESTITGRGVLAFGLLPVAAPGFAVAADLPAYRALHGTAGAVFLPEVRTRTGDFGFGLTAASAGACAVPWQGSRAALSFCGDLLLGAIHAVVYDLVPTEPGDRFWAGLAATTKLRVRLVGPLAAELGAELVVPLARQPFLVVRETGTVFQESAVAAMGFVGAGVSIP
jgi:hypothetical protein